MTQYITISEKDQDFLEILKYFQILSQGRGGEGGVEFFDTPHNFDTTTTDCLQIDR